MADTSSQKRTLWVVGQSNNEPFLIAKSPAMRQVLNLAARASDGDAKVLITDENGVSKDIIARLIHARSRRSPRPLIAVNCAAFSETLLESELFGHVKGSCTSAHRGRAEEAAAAAALPRPVIPSCERTHRGR